MTRPVSAAWRQVGVEPTLMSWISTPAARMAWAVSYMSWASSFPAASLSWVGAPWSTRLLKV